MYVYVCMCVYIYIYVCVSSIYCIRLCVSIYASVSPMSIPVILKGIGGHLSR